jgi:polyphosphate kinase 2 (PPK2 family)
MLARTSTSHARWPLVAAEDKRHGRIKVLKAVIAALKARIANA